MTTVGELIAELQKLDPAMEICVKVDGGRTRTGDYLPNVGVTVLDAYPVSYGGYEEVREGDAITDTERSQIREIAVI